MSLPLLEVTSISSKLKTLWKKGIVQTSRKGSAEKMRADGINKNTNALLQRDSVGETFANQNWEGLGNNANEANTVLVHTPIWPGKTKTGVGRCTAALHLKLISSSVSIYFHISNDHTKDTLHISFNPNVRFSKLLEWAMFPVETTSARFKKNNRAWPALSGNKPRSKRWRRTGQDWD